MDSGWDAKVHDATAFINMDAANTMHFPGFGAEAAAFLVRERHVVGIGVDTLSLDPGWDKAYNAHKVWLAADKWGVECVANLRHVPPSGAVVFVGGAKVGAATGGPVRLIACHPSSARTIARPALSESDQTPEASVAAPRIGTRRIADPAGRLSCAARSASSAGCPTDVRESYDSAATAYAAHLASELTQKPLDRHLLNRFAEATRERGLVADLGCGPGHVAKYLHDQGVTVVGIDISPEMIGCAARLNPDLEFRVGDMRDLDLPGGSLAGVVAFYSIVHFAPIELGPIMREIRRVLMPGGPALVSFHVGDQVVHVEDLFGAPVSLDFRFHVPRDVVEALESAGLVVTEHVERQPYEGAEYPSRRCYLLGRAGPPGLPDGAGPPPPTTAPAPAADGAHG